MRFSQKTIITSCALLITAGAAIAGEKEKAIADKVVKAYGGDRLLSLKKLGINERYKRLQFNQSFSTKEIDQTDFHISTVIDFENKRKSWRSVGDFGTEKYTQHQFFNGEKGYRLDHRAQTYNEDSSLNFASADRRLSYALDTYLVRLLHDGQASAVYQGEENVRGYPHEKIIFQPKDSPELTLYVNKESGLISKMTRPHWKPGETFSYYFNRPKRSNGILYASDTYVLNAGKPSNITVSRSIDTNPDTSGLYQLPSEFKEETQTLDFSSMSVKKLADDIYHAGKNWGFSIFVDAGDYFIASGGYQGLKDRFEAVKAFANMDKPLKYLIVTHHHTDHLGGMNEAAELGVTFVTLKEHVASIAAQLKTKVADDRYMTVSGDNSLVGGKVTVFDIPTPHSEHNLVSFIPSAKLVFSADHFYSRQKEGGIGVSKPFYEGLTGHAIKAERFAAAHSSRLLTLNDLIKGVQDIKPNVCPADWHICTK